MDRRPLTRMGGYVAQKRYFLLVAVSAILWACSVIAFCATFRRPYGSIETIVEIIAQGAVLGVAPFVAIVAALAFKPKSLRPSNYPRIEHLRIAGRYHPVRRFSADMGISPLHLRG
jgi:hypothetical protein